MWQRIQTLYLALAFVAVLFVVLGFDKTAFVVLASVALVLEFLALTVYRHRIFQMRTAVFAALILLGLQIWIGVDYYMAEDKAAFGIATVLPAVAIILDVLAARAILADELLVRSASRLRSAKKKH
ncbi:MAG: DUF4293 family protein [Bacteroidales bacterium]|nr:DUF4293 family protein [Bacteroidales bacterium]